MAQNYKKFEEKLKKTQQDLEKELKGHAEYLLEHQEEIPAEYRNYYLVFPGTVLQDSDGRHSVPCLSWYGGRWCLSFPWLGLGWGSRARFLRPRIGTF